MIDIKYCKECKEAFDIDTSKELCPKCRSNISIEMKGGIRNG